MRFISVLTFLFAFTGRLLAADLVETHPHSGMPHFLAKLKTGGEVRIGYLGGSITAQNGWRPKSLAWFQSQFPKARLSEINAAIGGTGSDLGVFRVQSDVLDRKPDLLFIEFAVNDGGADPLRIHRAMEGIIRKTWRANPSTDICFVYTISEPMFAEFKSGRLPRSQQAMEQLADHYGIPTINMGLEVARMEQTGKLIIKGTKIGKNGEPIVFSPDGVHPFPETGHNLYLAAIQRGMELIAQVPADARPHALIAPMVSDNWEQAGMYSLDQAKLSGGWKKLDPATSPNAKRFANRLPQIWLAEKPGQTLELTFRGTTLKIYDLITPDSGQLLVTIDSEPPKIISRFDSYATYERLSMANIASDLPEGVHRVKIELHSEQPDKAKILSQRNQKIDNPARFDATRWYAGKLLLIGELVER